MPDTPLLQEAPETTLLSHFSFPLALAQNFVDDHLTALKKVTDLFKSTFHHLADMTEPLTIGKPGEGQQQLQRLLFLPAMYQYLPRGAKL